MSARPPTPAHFRFARTFAAALLSLSSHLVSSFLRSCISHSTAKFAIIYVFFLNLISHSFAPSTVPQTPLPHTPLVSSRYLFYYLIRIQYYLRDHAAFISPRPPPPPLPLNLNLIRSTPPFMLLVISLLCAHLVVRARSTDGKENRYSIEHACSKRDAITCAYGLFETEAAARKYAWLPCSSSHRFFLFPSFFRSFLHFHSNVLYLVHDRLRSSGSQCFCLHIS